MPALFMAFLLAGCATSVPPPAYSEVASEVQEQANRTPAEVQDIQAQQLLVRGLTRAYMGDHEGALRLYREALRLRPNEPALLSAIATSQAALGDYTSAVFYAQQARTLAPDNPHYHQALAHHYLGAGDTEHAVEAYDTLLAHFPGHEESLGELARLQADLGRYAAALDTYEVLRARRGDSPPLLEQILQIHHHLGDLEGAEQTLHALIALEPTVAGLRRQLGQTYAAQGRPGDAAEAFEAALALDPSDAEAVLALAGLYRRQGEEARAEALLDTSMDVETASAAQLTARAAPLRARAADDPEAARSAIHLLDLALTRDPGNLEALVMLGDLHLQAGNPGAAAERLMAAAQQNPRDVQLWLRAATAYLRSGNAHAAATAADEGLLLFPGHLDLMEVAGRAHLGASHNTDALARFQDALALLEEEHPGDRTRRAGLLAALGLLHAREAAYATSDSLFARADAADPNHAATLNGRALSLARRGIRLAEAQALARQALDQDPGNPAYLDTVGWIYFKMDDLDQALQWIQRALDTGRAGAPAYAHYGDIMARQGRTDEARRYWEQALDRNPDNPDIARKLEQRDNGD